MIGIPGEGSYQSSWDLYNEVERKSNSSQAQINSRLFNTVTNLLLPNLIG